jgi:hypothetical protein
MSDTPAQVGTDPSTSRWNIGASMAAGLLAGAFLLVGITMPSQTASTGTASTGTQATASAVTDPAAPHVTSSTTAPSTASSDILMLAADIDD